MSSLKIENLVQYSSNFSRTFPTGFPSYFLFSSLSYDEIFLWNISQRCESGYAISYAYPLTQLLYYQPSAPYAKIHSRYHEESTRQILKQTTENGTSN